MKELSIEEKAKRFDEALATAKECITYVPNDAVNKYMLNMFPELKESEDERIRKAIKSVISYNIGNNKIYGVSKEDMLAWLEKQGEQKPADKVEPKFKIGDIVKHKDNPHLTYILKRFTDGGDYEFHAIGKDGHEGGTCFAVVKYQDEWELVEQNPADKVDQHSLPVSDNSSLPTFDESIYHPCTEEVYEQKPTAWSEDDEKQLQHTIAVIQWYAGGTDIIDWIKSLKNRVQPKQKLSEEDESKRKFIEDELSGLIADEINIESPLTKRARDLYSALYWLKDLKDKVQPQPRQEWSEENEKMLKDTIRFCELCGNQVSSNWLKSLRPQSQWRPSEEQMKALGIAIRSGIQLGTWEEDALKSLAEQLKKLRE